MSQKGLICPKCGSPKILPVRYSPPPGVFGLEDCYGVYIRKDQPAGVQDPGFHCQSCAHEWGENTWVPFLRLQSLRADVQTAGRMTACVSADGFTRCPHCQRVFSTKDERRWDGNAHARCKGEIALISSLTNEK